VTEEWFARRTSQWRDWDLAAITAAKGGHRISLILPARNEAATIGPIVARVLADLSGLLDEVIVLDSDSTDATAKIAAEAGAIVHSVSDVRPDLGHRVGKGEAMWKAQFVATGDLLVFMDADLTEWDTHFVTGLLGPLLADPSVSLVKGFYDRPFVHSEVPTPDEGGRVTELVARPLLSLFWPELAGVVQPLAGEWAIRRSLLASLPVSSGYGVELGVLVDTYRSLGVDAIAQVDLGLRTHSHQTLRELGAMATQLLAFASRRLASDARTTAVLQQFSDNLPAPRDVDVSERPPAEGLA
jgi:glucosyl-3-phosphoglycerate synthase